LDRGSEVFTNTVDIEPGGRMSLIYDLQYSDDGQLLAATNGGALYIVDAGRGDQLQGYYEAIPRGQREDFWIMSLDTGDKSGGFIAGDWSGRILVYDASSPRPQEEHDTDLSSLLRLERIPGSSELIVNTFGTLYRYDVRSNELDLLIEDDNLNDFDLSPDGDLMAVGLDGYWLLYDVEQDAVLAEMPFGDSNNRVYSLAFSPSSDRVAVMGTDGHVAIWDVNSGQIVTEIAQFDEAESPKWR
jgi:WD40 repeat protein